jgi:ligand-binding sensor domain-containing protein
MNKRIFQFIPLSTMGFTKRITRSIGRRPNFSRLFQSAIALIAATAAFGQQPSWVNHLSTAPIYCLAEEGDIVWAGSSGGLLKVDKSSGLVTSFNTLNSDLPDNAVTSIVVGPDGRKWIGTLNGLAEFDGSVWKVYRVCTSWLEHYNQNDCLSVHFLATDGAGNLWINEYYRNYVIRYDGRDWTKISLPANKDIVGMGSDRDGKLWFAMDSNYSHADPQDVSDPGRVARFDESGWALYTHANSSLPECNIYSMSIDQNGVKWFLTSVGILKLQGDSWSIHASVTDLEYFERTQAFSVDLQGHVWTGILYWDWKTGNLMEYDGSGWENHTRSIPLLEAGFITSILVDRNGEKWFGTSNGSVVSFDGAAFRNASTANGLPSNEVTAVSVGPDGTKWIGTADGLVHFDGATWTIPEDFNPDFFDYTISSILCGPDERVWVALTTDWQPNGAVMEFNGE